jgi:hypothetical protein
MRKRASFPTPSLDLPAGEERASCPRCGRLLIFSAGRERLACDHCRADWLRPATGTRPLAFRGGDRRLALGRRWIGAQHRPRFPFVHALHAEPEVRDLAREFGISRRLRGRTQWARQRDLLRVLRVEVFRKRPSARVLRRLGLGTVTRTDQHWFCTHFAYLYSVFAASLGWTARILNIGRDNPENTAGHMIAEIWSDEWQKWVVVDPLYAGWFSRRGRPGEPLSFLEVHRDWIERGGRNVVLHHRVRSSSADLIGPERSLPALRDDTKNRYLHPSTYFWGIAYLTNRFLTEPYEEGRFLALLWRDRWNRGRPWVNRGKPVGYYRARHVVETATALDFHPPLNNTAVWLLVDPSGPRLFLRTHSPNFSHFEMACGSRWRRVPSEFPLPRTGTWRFRAVNRFGEPGRPSEIFVG